MPVMPKSDWIRAELNEKDVTHVATGSQSSSRIHCVSWSLIAWKKDLFVPGKMQFQLSFSQQVNPGPPCGGITAVVTPTQGVANEDLWDITCTGIQDNNEGILASLLCTFQVFVLLVAGAVESTLGCQVCLCCFFKDTPLCFSRSIQRLFFPCNATQPIGPSRTTLVGLNLLCMLCVTLQLGDKSLTGVVVGFIHT